MRHKRTDYSRLLSVKSDLLRRIKNLNGTLATDLEDIALPWYEIRNEADGDDSTTEVFIYDEIGGWFGTPVEDFVKELNGIKTSAITVRINSPGGSLFDSVAIYNTLVQHRAKVLTRVDALAASGASIIAMAGDEVEMMVGSQLMIHDALGVEIGNAKAMREMASFLDKQSDNIASIYAARAGGDAADYRALMLKETWMFADEAVAMGLADRVFGAGIMPHEEEPEEDEEEDSTEDEEETTAEEDEESTEDGEEEVEDSIENLMNHRHRLASRGWKHAGRTRAPAPPIKNDWEKFVDSILS
jgi:ATP-dependent protease ClpP protease subunit